MLNLNQTENFNNQSTKTFFAANGLPIENAPNWLPKAKFSRTDSDLIAENLDRDVAVFVDFFSNFELPPIITDNGLMLKGSLLLALAGSRSTGEYAQASSSEMLSIGEVSNIQGVAKAQRLDGSIVELNVGNPMFGDTKKQLVRQ